jgi:fumarylacetoacetase
MKLDIELELAAFVCKSNRLGEPIPISEAEEYVFGVVLMNDWSARDIQAWEYVPLGPFGSKNFGTTISPWVVLPDALEPFRAEKLQSDGDGGVLEYLRESKKDTVYDINLEVELKTKDSTTPTTICKTNSKNLLYSFPQMLAHHSVTGCNMNTGDLLGSGTISGTETGSVGSLLEKTKSGKEPIKLADGSSRTFLEDGDEITIKGICGDQGAYVGFGECKGVILPALVK